MDDAIRQALQDIGLDATTPGYAILEAPLPISMDDTSPLKLLRLMYNFFDYGRGRGNWAWVSGLLKASGPDSYAKPQQRGINLLNGTSHTTNCDGFRLAFINLATNVLQVDGVKCADIGPIQNGGYLTKPGTVTIDSSWAGNVRTERQSFHELKVFKFSEHHFAVYQGRFYDPTTNMTFLHRDDVKWCTYTLETDQDVLGNFRRLRVFRIETRFYTNPPCQGRYLVEIGSSGGWPTNLLTANDRLDLGSLAMMSAGASRS